MNLKNTIINGLIVFFSIVIGLVLVEIFLRINGQGPLGNLEFSRNDPTINKPHEKLGWEPKEGTYKFESFSSEGQKFEINILSDGSRKISNENKTQQNDQIVFIGGSVMLGWGVNDDQTFTSLLQKRIKNYKIKNFASGGYGTYQSFLRLEQILKTNNKVKTVILSYYPHHSIRNIGSEFWLRTLNKYSKRGYVSLPYAFIDDRGKLNRVEPITYIKVPFMYELSIFNKLAKRIMKYKLKDNEKHAIKVTNVIFEEIKILLDSKNIQFIVLDLAEKKGALDPYTQNFKEKKIDFISCNFKQTDKLTIKGDGHPNNLMHKKFSECIYKNLKNILKS